MGAEVEALIAQLRPVVDDERVLAAIAAVPREEFVPADQRSRAYANVALPIGHDQTISQPLVVARMLLLLAPGPEDHILDIGTGSGYHAVLLAHLAGHVHTVERHPELSRRAQAAAERLRIANITFLVGDGSEGCPEHGPFDAINVGAAATAVPVALERQLAPGGRLVIPTGEMEQHLVCVRRTDAGLRRERHEAVRFVPLLPGTPGGAGTHGGTRPIAGEPPLD